MANVIPSELQSSTRSAARARFILSTSVVALVCAALVLLMLLPSYAALTQDASGTSGAASISPQTQAADKVTLTQTTALLSVLSPIASATTTPSEAVTQALSLRPAGVSVDQIMYTAGTPSTLVLFGAAQNGNEISAYRTALASSTMFTSATVPVGALVGADSGRFTITLSGSF